MLMHVSPREVAGLQAIGQMTGHKLHTNPHTGMPEAFDFGSFITSLLPTVAGFMVGGPMGAGLGLEAGTTAATIAPIAAGMATGAAVAGAKGDDVLTGGLMGGLGGYGGGNLAGSFGNMGAQGGYEASKNIVGPQLTAEGGLSSAGSGQGMAATLAKQAAPATTFSQGLSQTGRGLMETLKPGGFDKFTTPIAQGGAGGSAFQLAAPVGMAALSGAQEDLYPEADQAEEEKRKALANKYRSKDPDYILNLSPDSGLRLASGGAVPGSGTVFGTQAYNQDSTNAFSKPDGTTAQNTPSESYGLGRLDNLMNQGANAKAANEFYAVGGPVEYSEGGLGSIYAHGGYLDGEGDGMSDSIHASIDGKQPARLADGEFVVPADVVSHIGNGSSKAGAQRLYSMLHKVRQARTGTPKQGKQINPNKYLPT
jgi:hypothetical protein